MQASTHKQGFTLIELVSVIVILGIVSVGVSSFIRDSTQIFVDTTERDQLLSDSRFVIERLNRELRRAVPNSVRIGANGDDDCIEFVPIEWSSFYLDIPVLPESGIDISVFDLTDFAGNSHEFDEDEVDYALVYPLNDQDVYDLNEGRRLQIDTHTDETDETTTLEVDGEFEAHSPASRLYIVRDMVSYCVDDDAGQILRYQDAIDSDIYSASAVLMAQYVANNLGDSDDTPFTLSQASPTRNGAVTIMLRFSRNNEIVEFNNEVHIANVP